MTNTKGIILLFTLATILITGGLTMAPLAYSTGNGDDSHGDDSHGDDSHGDDSHGDDSHGDDSHGDDSHGEPDCECEKPTVFSVIYNGPGIDGIETGPDAEVTVEIYKKVNDIGDKDPLLTIEGIFDGESIIIDSNVYGKKKINSNTVYRVIQNDVEIAVISFHTSCSQSLFIGDMHTDGPVTVTVEYGFDHKGNQSIFLPIDPLCNEIPTTTLEVRKILSPEDDLGTFILQIDGVGTTEVGNGGVLGPVDVIPGPHTIGEIAGSGTVLTDYTAIITGDCNADGSIDLVEGDNAVCTITNTKIIPTTITLNKVLTNDNGGTRSATDFGVNIDNGPPVMLGMPIDITPGVSHFINETEFDDYSFVLMSGDTSCPSMLEESFTLNEGEQITCTIYNDDNFVEGQTGGGPGVVFHFETIMIKLSPAGGGPADCAVTGNVAPCIEILGEKTFIVRPDTSAASQDLTSTTLILLTVVPTNDFDLATQCTVSGLNAVGTTIDGFGVKCLDTTTGADPFNDYNFNLALIETAMS